MIYHIKGKRLGTIKSTYSQYQSISFEVIKTYRQVIKPIRQKIKYTECFFFRLTIEVNVEYIMIGIDAINRIEKPFIIPVCIGIPISFGSNGLASGKR